MIKLIKYIETNWNDIQDLLDTMLGKMLLFAILFTCMAVLASLIVGYLC